MRKNILLATLASILALTFGTITSFASEPVISTAGNVLSIYPMAQTLVVGTAAAISFKGGSSTLETPIAVKLNINTVDLFKPHEMEMSNIIEQSNSPSEGMQVKWDALTEAEKDKVLNCLSAITDTKS